MLVASMARSRWPWTNSAYVCICLYFCVLEFLGVIRIRYSVRPWSDPHFVSQYTTMAMVGVRLSWLYRWHDLVCPGRTDCTSVFFCAWLLRRGSMQCGFIISPWCLCHNIFWWQWPACVYLGCDNLVGPGRTACTFICNSCVLDFGRVIGARRS